MHHLPAAPVLTNPTYIISCAMIPRGRLIVLEGLDRSGKSSVCRYILSRLQAAHHQAEPLSFPDRSTPIGKMINDFLLNKADLPNEAIHLLFSANRWENAQRIKDTLQAGVSIVCDRYWYSGVAYSVAKGMDLGWCSAADRGLVQPDLVIYLKAEAEVLSQRANFGEERFEKVEFQRKVQTAFEELLGGEKAVKVVEVGGRTLGEVEEEVGRLVDQLLLQ